MRDSTGSAALLEMRERQRGRYAGLLSQAEDTARRIMARTTSVADATTVRVLIDIIARQEIELRQAVKDKNARPMVERT